VKIAIVGCGNIAGSYSKDIKQHPSLNLLGFSDLDAARAQAFANEHGGKAYDSLEALLADEAVETVVNLTIHHAHYDVIKQALNAGKHVYTEKPLALSFKEAQELVDLAATKNLRLGCAPITFLGEAQQSAMKLVRDGTLGKVRVVYAEVNHGRIETWHPNPAPFYDVGPMWDVGVYPLAFLTALFGPAKAVTAFARTLQPDRVTKDGAPFHVDSPDYYVANLEFDDVLVRLTANFYVPPSAKQPSAIEFHGDTASLFLGSWFVANAALELAPYQQDFETVPLAQATEVGIDWARGLQDFTDAIQENRASRVSGAHAAHVVEILEAVSTSAKNTSRVALTSSFPMPDLMDWAK
jgi:predicted dehydrogenase